MINWFKDKLGRIWYWSKKKVRWILVGTLTAATALGLVLAPAPIPEHAILKAPAEHIIGNVERNGIVKYAYKTHETLFVENEISRTKHSRTFKIGERIENGKKIEIRQLEVISGVPQYYEEAGKWYQADYATTTKKHFNKQTKPLFSVLFNRAFAVSTSTFYPDPDPESTSVDGRVFRSSVNESFATIRAGAGNSATDDGATGGCPRIINSANSPNFSTLTRCYYFFDTSALTAAVTITHATLSLSRSSASTANFGGNVEVDFVNTSASTTALVTGDYAIANFDGVKQATNIAFGSIGAGYNDFILNATGTLNIDKTGITKFGTRSDWDMDNSNPGYITTNSNDTANFYYSEQTGTANDPKLVVTYEVVSEARRIISVQ